MNYSRDTIEFLARANAKVLDETEKWKLVRVLGDIPMYVMKGDESVAPHLEHDGFWESWITKWVLDNTEPNTIFWDIGANTGYYSLAAVSKGAGVMAFEPNPKYYEMLLATKEYNSAPMRIFNVALSDTEGTETLYLPKSLHGSASFTEMDEQWEVTPIEVKTRTLAQYQVGLGNRKHILKIDAEGAEEKIWHGAEGFKGDVTILMEYTPGAYSHSFLDELEDWSGGLQWINHDGQAEPIDKQTVRNQGDWIMLLLEQKK